MKPSVVVGYDETPSSERALLEAAREAVWRGASLTVLTAFHWPAAVPPTPYAPTDLQLSVRKAAGEIADHGAGIVCSRYPGMTVTALVEEGPTAETLAHAASAADLLVLGNRGRGGFSGLLLGSVSMRALHSASVPTLVVRGSAHEPRDLVVVAVDVADPGDEPLEFAFGEASRRGARLEILHAWDRPWFLMDAEGSDDVAQAVRQIRSECEASLRTVARPWQVRFPDVRTAYRVADGSPGAVLNEASRRADLVVVGAHRRSEGRPGLRVGPLAHTVAHHADCPVAVVPRAAVR
jgi:nucleotide-binding universal stress UspA family protein